MVAQNNINTNRLHDLKLIEERQKLKTKKLKTKNLKLTFKLSASHGIPLPHSMIPRHCDTQRQFHSGDQQRVLRQVF